MITDAKIETLGGEKIYVETDVTTFVLMDEEYKLTSYISHPVGHRAFKVQIHTIEHKGDIQEWSQFQFEYKFENELIKEFFTLGHLEKIILYPNEEALEYSKSGYCELSESQIRHAVEEGY